MLRGPKLWVRLILNVIGVRLRFIGTHFDHNRYIIRIFIFLFFLQVPMEPYKSFGLPSGGYRIYFSLIIIFYLLLVTPSIFQKWGKKLNQNFPLHHPSLFLATDFKTHIPVSFSLRVCAYSVASLSSSSSFLGYVVGLRWWGAPGLRKKYTWKVV